MAFPQNPTDKQRYKNYTYDSISRSWKQDYIYQEQLDLGSDAGGLNSDDIPILGRAETVQEFIIDTEEFIDTVSARQIIADDGLTGSGTLSADITLAVDSTVVRTSGVQTIGGAKTFSSMAQVSLNTSSPTYANGHLELRSSNASSVSMGFHRAGHTSCQLRHDSNGLILSGSSQAAAANLVVTGNITGASVFGAVYNDIADFITVEDECEIIPGLAYFVKNKKHSPTTKYCQKGTIGICTDTFGFAVGVDPSKKLNKLPIAIAGFVLAYIVGKAEEGDPLVSYKDGALKKANLFTKIFFSERIIGIFYKDEDKEVWNNIKVNSRKWVKVK